MTLARAGGPTSPAPADVTAKAVREVCPEASVLALDRNHGAWGRTLGAAHAGTPRVVLGAVGSGRPGVAGLLRALPDVPAALLRRPPVHSQVRADLRRRATDAA